MTVKLLGVAPSGPTDAATKAYVDSLLSGGVGSPSAVDLGNLGDGSDGDVTVSTTVALTRDMFYNSLHVTGTGKLQVNGFRFYVKGTGGVLVDSGGRLTAGGNDAVGVGGASQSNGGANTIQGTRVGIDGKANGGFGALSGRNGYGGAGGTGGTGSAGAGSGGGSVTTINASLGSIRAFPQGLLGAVVGLGSGSFTWPEGGNGGGGGNGDTVNAGGGGGAGAGVLLFSALAVVNNGTIDVNGGAGGNGANTGNIGGGGGGGGGWLSAYVGSWTGNAATANGGAGGPGHGTGTNGSAGSAGLVVVNIVGLVTSTSSGSTPPGDQLLLAACFR